MKKSLHILFAALIALMFVPMIQEGFGFFRERPLQGAFEPVLKPRLGINEWFSGSCQDSLSDYYNHNFGLRPWFVRINNQIDFSLFSKTNAAKIVIGKQGYLYEDNYLHAYEGSDFVGEQAIDSLISSAVRTRDLLKAHNTDLLIVLAPGKATFFPEYIPHRYSNNIAAQTNYEMIAAKCNEAGLLHIDLNKWFVEMKDTASFPLYPKCGIHWSYYGMYLSADTIVKTIEKIRATDIPDMVLESIEMSDEQRGTDYDIGHTLNLLFPIKTYPMAYPTIAYKGLEKPKPDVLVIGDSYYWNMYYSGIPSVLFKKLDFYYYNSSIYNDGTNVSAGSTDNIDYINSILQRDVVILLQTDGGLNYFGFGFFDKINNELSEQYLDERIEYFKQLILSDPKWTAQVQEKASARGISFEEMLLIDAKYMCRQKN